MPPWVIQKGYEPLIQMDRGNNERAGFRRVPPGNNLKHRTASCRTGMRTSWIRIFGSGYSAGHPKAAMALEIWPRDFGQEI